MPRPLPPSFYLRDTATVARELLGKLLTRVHPDGRIQQAVIVETEAYLGQDDAAAHTYKGRNTARVAPMWGEGGQAYVYLVYGMHHCMNVVTREAGIPQAVLLRAAVPLCWWEQGEGTKDALAAMSGPGKLCRALGVTRAESGASFAGPELVLSEGPSKEFDVLTGPRVGVAYAGEAASWELRFAVADCPSVTRRSGLHLV